ncbi:MAG: YezD family protein [Verrucomicrobiia bacterium]|jgi:hypothetical protein
MSEESKLEKGKEADWLALVQQHVQSLRYGLVQIVVHDGRVTQVEKTERVRLNQPPPAKKG